MSNNLPKGFSVVYRYKFGNLKYFKIALERDKLEAEIKDNIGHIEGFIANDTDEKGISVVALSNPEICLISYKLPNYSNNVLEKVRNLMRRGYIYSDEYVKSEQISQFLSNPTCQFK